MGQVSKLNYVDAKLGAPTSGQQTTRILFNTIENPGTTSQLLFFKNFQGLTNGQTNLNQNKLDSMESMVIKSVWFTAFSGTAGVGGIAPIGGLKQQTFSIIVGNQTVVKDMPIAFNQGTNSQSLDRLHAFAGAATGIALGVPTSQTQPAFLPVEIRLLTDIVIPPQVSFEVRLDSNNAAYPTTGAVVCALAGYGKIFSAGASF